MASPNLYEDNKGKVTKENGSGGFRTFNMELLPDSEDSFIIHGADVDDLNGIFYLNFEYDNVMYHQSYIYAVNDDMKFITAIGAGEFDIDALSIDGKYFDGVKVTLI